MVEPITAERRQSHEQNLREYRVAIREKSVYLGKFNALERAKNDTLQLYVLLGQKKMISTESA
jgi:hypothetical protein